jgi:hypothetical protein
VEPEQELVPLERVQEQEPQAQAQAPVPGQVLERVLQGRVVALGRRHSVGVVVLPCCFTFLSGFHFFPHLRIAIRSSRSSWGE